MGSQHRPILRADHRLVPAFILFAGGAIAPNPLSISFSRRPFDPDRPGIVAVTRHPLLWAFAIWAFAHVVPNGALVSLIMFGGFGLFALAGMALMDRRKRRQLGSGWEPLAGRTSAVPFLPSRGPRLPWDQRGLGAATIAAALLYAALLHLHPWLFGPDPKLVFAA